LLQSVGTRIEQEPEAPVLNSRNWIVRFDKLDGSVLLGSTAVRGAAELRRGASSPAKRRLDGGEARTTTTLGVEAAATRSNCKKTKRIENYGKTKKKVNCI
jgi:hypothetical protein